MAALFSSLKSIPRNLYLGLRSQTKIPTDLLRWIVDLSAPLLLKPKC